MTDNVLIYDVSDPSTALSLSQKSSGLLSRYAGITSSFSLPIIGATESPEAWQEHQQTFYACLQTGDDKTAKALLDRLTLRFGEKDERVMAMRGLYQEAVAEGVADLREILEDYDKILDENPMNVSIHKRRIALVRSIGEGSSAISSLVDFLNAFPTDSEAWCELSALYQAQGLMQQAIFSLEEALISAPNAWNLHAKLGELEYMAASSTTENAGDKEKHLVQAVHRFSRSIELCDDYLRGFYGLKLAANKLKESSRGGQNNDAEGIDRKTLEKLEKFAISRMREIIDSLTTENSFKLPLEVSAAKALLGSTVP